MKDYSAIKHLIELLQEQCDNLMNSKEYYKECLQDEVTKQESIKKNENGNYYWVDINGEREDISSWDAERIGDHIKVYTAKIKAYDIILDTLSSIDLNKIKM